MTNSGHLIHALHLFSPSLPIGAFAFSQDSRPLSNQARLRPRIPRPVVRQCDAVFAHDARLSLRDPCIPCGFRVNVSGR